MRLSKQTEEGPADASAGGDGRWEQAPLGFVSSCFLRTHLDPLALDTKPAEPSPGLGVQRWASLGN